MEGPTARECLLYSMIDDDEQDVYFRAYGRIIAAEESTRHVLQRMLGPYDPGFDYGPWIAQTRREYIGHVVHGVNKQVAVWLPIALPCLPGQRPAFPAPPSPATSA